MTTFNEFQQMAIRHLSGPALVLAGPGSGKTLVITHRIQQLIASGVAPENILVITFTRAAATEMKTRFEALTDGKKQPVTFGTFHSVYFRVLKYAYHYEADQIIGEEARLRLLSEVLSDTELTMAEEDIEFLKEILSEISLVKSDLIPLDHYYAKSCSEKLFRKLYEGYEEKLRTNRVIDFDDMLMLCHELFTGRKDILAAWQRKFRYILVDEFQDINRLQYEILRMLAGESANLFVVGDDDQAIYRFRGARPEIMLGFEREYPNAKKYFLGINYRCPEKVIKAAGNVIAHNEVRFKKDIRGIGRDTGPIHMGVFEDENKECDKLLAHAVTYHEQGIPYEEMAVLVRTNIGARSLISRMLQKGIPFQTKDMVPSIYDHWICMDVFSYLRAALGEESRQVILRIINRPLRYVSRTAFSGFKDVTLDQLEAMYEDDAKHWMAERIHTLRTDLRHMRKLSPYQAIQYLRRAVGYDDFLRAYAKEQKIKEEELFEVLEELCTESEKFETFPVWQEHARKFREEMKHQRALGKADGEGIVISTMHGAKGLEYRVVFLPDVNENVIPHEKAGIKADLEEERRLFYVAMTRAKEKLHIYSVRNRHGKACPVSRFAAELKKEYGPVGFSG